MRANRIPFPSIMGSRLDEGSRFASGMTVAERTESDMNSENIQGREAVRSRRVGDPAKLDLPGLGLCPMLLKKRTWQTARTYARGRWPFSIIVEVSGTFRKREGSGLSPRPSVHSSAAALPRFNHAR